MTLIELMKELDRPVDTIEVRINSPLEGEKDTLYGYCAWDGKKIISLDGDDYDENEELVRYEENKDGSVTVWEKTNWSYDEHYDFDVQQKIAKEIIKPVLDWYRKRINFLFQEAKCPLRSERSDDLNDLVKTYLATEELFLEILEEEKEKKDEGNN